MEYEAPGLFDDGTGVSREKARTEVMAQAFADVSGGYFERQKEYEDAIDAAESAQSNAKTYAVLAVIAALVVAGVGALASVDLFIGLGVLFGLIGVGYAYRKYSQAKAAIESQRANLRENDPDGSVKFVSQISVPFYLVPYADSHMVFDGLESAPSTSLDLAMLDGDALVSRWEDLEETHSEYQEHAAGEGVVSPEYAQQFADDVTEHRVMERPVARKIDAMTAVLDDVDTEEISVNVYANDTKAQSLQQFASKDVLRSNSDLPHVETTQSIGECEAMVADIRGVEEKAVSGDMLDQAREHHDKVDSLVDEMTARLKENHQTVTDHGETFSNQVESSVDKHVCQKCLEEETTEVLSELSMVNTVFSSNTSFGVALDDADLEDATTASGEPFKKKIRNELGQHLPEPEEALAQAFNRLPDLGDDGSYCQTHEDVETVAISDSGVVFGEVWRSLYYKFRDPILDSARQLESEAEDIRQHKEQRMMDLAEYEQARDSYELQYKAMQSEFSTAEEIQRNLSKR